MSRSAGPGFILQAWLLATLFLVTIAGAAQAEDWKFVTTSGEVKIFERAHTGSSLREYRGIGVIAAPPLAVKHVLDDVMAYPHFMPYVVEARMISSDATSRVSYQRLSPPIVGDRDYTVKVHFETHSAAGGIAYLSHWQAANELGPPEKSGVTRVKLSEGSWLLEPLEGGHQTQATYTIYTDSGGNMPAFLLNTAGKTAVPKVFAAVRSQAALPKYSAEAH